MPLWLQITFLAATIPTVLAGLILFGGGIKTQDYTKNDRAGSSGGDGGGGFDIGGCDGGGDGD